MFRTTFPSLPSHLLRLFRLRGRARSQLVVKAFDRAPAIARTAVLRMADQTVVFVFAGDLGGGGARFVRRIVAVNDDNGEDYLPVVRGVAAGDRVVTAGAILLSGML